MDGLEAVIGIAVRVTVRREDQPMVYKQRWVKKLAA